MVKSPMLSRAGPQIRLGSPKVNRRAANNIFLSGNLRDEEQIVCEMKVLLTIAYIQYTILYTIYNIIYNIQ